MIRPAVKSITNAISKNTKQALKPIFTIRSRYAEPMADAAFSPDGKWFATRSDTGRVHIWRITTGQREYALSTESDTISAMAFGKDTIYLADSSGIISRRDIGSGLLSGRLAGHTAEISKIIIHGNLLYSAGTDGQIIVWDLDSMVPLQTIAPRDKSAVLTLSLCRESGQLAAGYKDGRILLWNPLSGEKIQELKSSKKIQVLALGNERILAAGYTDGSVALWDLAKNRKILDKTLRRGKVRALEISPDNFFLATVGNNNQLMLLSLADKKTYTLKGHTGEINAVRFSNDGNFILTVSDDRTARFWDVKNQKERVRIVSMKNGWAVVSLNGQFDGTLDGELEDRLDAIQWQVGNQAFSVDGFLETYYRPALLGKILTYHTIKKSPSLPHVSSGFSLPPSIQFITPANDSTTEENTVAIIIKAFDQGGGIDDVRLYHNKKIVDDSTATVEQGKDNEQSWQKKIYRVTLLDNKNRFRSVALSLDRIEGKADQLVITKKIIKPEPKQNLHLVTIGINKYKNAALNLDFAVPDAKTISSYFSTSAQKLFGEIIKYELYDDKATLSRINTTLALLQNSPPQDVVVIYLSGHGDTIRDLWHFIPYDLVNPESDDDLRKNGISSSTLQLLVTQMGARRIFLLLDSCKSGALIETFEQYDVQHSFAVLARSTGIHIGAATTKGESAYELQDLGHGLFTYSLMQGINGRADQAPADGNVSVRELLSFVKIEIPRLVKRHQIPRQIPMVNSRGVDFPIAAPTM